MARFENPRMGQALKQARQRVTQEVFLEAPIGGWNTRDAIDNIPPPDAIILDNWIPDFGSVKIRKGWDVHCDSDDIDGHTGSHVESLMVYHGAASTRLLAADGGRIWNATTVSSPVSLATGFTSNRWQYANMDNKMAMVNGHASDAPQQYDGSTVSALTLTGSGLTANNVIGVNVFKSRSYFWEDNSQDFWYSAVDTLGGACTKFPLSRVGSFGGKLIAMKTWTMDGGSGPDDHAVFFMSSGEAIVYQGASPSAGADWALVGIYHVGSPLSVRGFAKFGGDIIMMTTLDFVRLSEIIQGAETYTPGHKAIGAIRDAVLSNASNWGWEAVVFSRENLLIFNVPITSNSEYQQFVLNMATGAWCRFTGLTANTWAVFNNELYFGTSGGVVAKAFSGYDDNGSQIETELQSAWLPMGGKTNKTFVGVEYVYRMGTELAENSSFATDYREHSTLATPAANAPGATAWGSPWGSAWSTASTTQRLRRLVRGFGRVISLRQKAATKDLVEWFGSTWLFRTSRRSF